MDDQNLKDLEREQADNQLIGNAFQHLLDTYLSSRHRKKVDIVTKAFNFARQAHKGVRRLSGEPYIMHPIAVAQIACEEMGLGSTSICAALLFVFAELFPVANQMVVNPSVLILLKGTGRGYPSLLMEVSVTTSHC